MAQKSECAHLAHPYQLGAALVVCPSHAVAIEAAPPRRLVAGNMADFPLEQRFALTIIPARALRFLITPAEQRAALQGINRHLVSGVIWSTIYLTPSFKHLLLAREAQDPRSGHAARAVFGFSRRCSALWSRAVVGCACDQMTAALAAAVQQRTRAFLR
jgi:hypothetical protein